MYRLHDYQERSIADVQAKCRDGARAPLLVGPTGSGKTVMGSTLAAMHLARGAARSVAWFVHRSELVDQAAAAFRVHGIPVGVRGEGKRERVQVVMVQTCLARSEIPECSLAVFDEAHHYVSEEWKRVPDFYRGRGTMILGLTATPERSDRRGLGGADGIFDALTVGAQTAELISKGQLAPFEIHEPTAAVRSGCVAVDPVDAYLAHSPGRSAVVFAPNIANADRFAEQFRARGVRAEVVHGKLRDDERAARLARFGSGETAAIVNVGVLTEGWDEPRCKVAIFARKIGSVSLYLQMVGRALRLYRGESATIIDLTGVVRTHGPPDEDREYFLEGEACRRVGEGSGVSHCPVCGTPRKIGTACPECLTAPSETEILKAQNIALAKFAGMRAMGDDERVRTLARWYADADAKGHKRASRDFKFAAVFNGRPSAEIRARAHALADQQQNQPRRAS